MMGKHYKLYVLLDGSDINQADSSCMHVSDEPSIAANDVAAEYASYVRAHHNRVRGLVHSGGGHYPDVDYYAVNVKEVRDSDNVHEENLVVVGYNEPIPDDLESDSQWYTDNGDIIAHYVICEQPE